LQQTEQAGLDRVSAPAHWEIGFNATPFVEIVAGFGFLPRCNDEDVPEIFHC
jgi:hypothetical protein